MTETIAIIAGVVGLMTAVVGLIVRLNRSLRRLNTMVDDWNGEPARPGVAARPGVMERLDKVEHATSDIRYHVQPNHGHSAHDDVMRQLKTIQGGLESMNTRMTLSEVDRERMHHEISNLARKFIQHTKDNS